MVPAAANAAAVAGDEVTGKSIPATTTAGATGGNQMQGQFLGALSGMSSIAAAEGYRAGMAFATAFNAAAANVSTPSIPQPVFSHGIGPGATFTPSHSALGEMAFAGGGDVPFTGRHLLHRKEMVLPERYAEVIRQMASSGSSGTGGRNVQIGTLKVADTIVVRNDQDVEEIKAALAQQLATYTSNTSVYAAEE